MRAPELVHRGLRGGNASDHTLSGVMLQLQALRKNRLRMFAMLESFEGFKGCKVKKSVWDFYFTLSPHVVGRRVAVADLRLPCSKALKDLKISSQKEF